MTSINKLDSKTLTIGIIGYTGETGKDITKNVLQNNLFKQVVLIGRRKVDYKEDFYKDAVILRAEIFHRIE
jgi:putative NADH-flavin reductase